MKVTSNILASYYLNSGKDFAEDLKVADFETGLAANKELSRVIIDLTGVSISTLSDLRLGRNWVAATEPLIENLLWAILGIAGPLFFLKHWGALYNKQFINSKYSMSHSNPLETDFSMLDGAFLDKHENQQKLAKHLGVKDISKIPEIAKRIRIGKSSIMLTGLIALTFFSQWVFRFRNFLTQKLSKQKYFPVGTDDASNQFLKQEAEKFEKDQKLRRLLSLVIGFGANTLLPLFYYFLVSSKTKTGLIGGLKKNIIPKIEYHKAIFMPKLVLATHTIFNYNFNVIFAFSRNFTEVLEKFRKILALDILYFFGDSVFEGLAGKYFENKHKDELKGIKLTNKGWFGIPVGRPLHKIQEEIKSHHSPKVNELVDKLARWNFRIGIVSAGVLLGMVLEVFSVLATKQRLQNQTANQNPNGSSNQPSS